jgi:hypothetical protein
LTLKVSTTLNRGLYGFNEESVIDKAAAFQSGDSRHDRILRGLIAARE